MPKENPKLMFRAEQLKTESGAAYKLYVYDSVRAKGDFDWNTWEYKESETSAKYFRDKLDEIPDGSTIELHVNSAGGEVGEGVTIYNLLKQKADAGTKIIGYVDGMAYSVAMDIIMAADEIHMGLGTSMFLHNPWAAVAGNADQLRSMAEQLDTLAAASRQLYMARTQNLTEDELKEMMDKETMLSPDDCKKYGFCDVVGMGDDELHDEPEEEDPEEEPEDKDAVIGQLKEQLFRQQQINQMLRHTRADMGATMLAALESIKHKA